MAGPKVGRIRRRATFRDLARPTGRSSRGPLRISYTGRCELAAPARPAVAYAVGRQVGNAVERNRLRRRLRAGVQGLAHGLEPGSYLVRAHSEAGALSYHALVGHLGPAMLEAAARARSAQGAP